MRRGLTLLTVFLCACGSSSVREAALNDDLPGLQRAIRDAQERRELDESTAKGLAQAVIERELASARGDARVERVREVRACIGSVEAALDELSEQREAGGGAALLALLEAGRVDADGLVELYAADADPDWRAVGARAAVGAEHSALRQRLLLDPDLRVRRAVLYAARQEPSLAERDALLEAARLDPDPLVRSVAVQTLAALGDSSAVTALGDLWTRSDLALRQEIVDAYAHPASYAKGGEARLLATLETERGLPALVAARGLVRNESVHAPLAKAALLRAVESGPADERRLALRWVPLDAAGTSAVLAAMKSEDAMVSVIAAARLSGVDAQRSAGTNKLRALSTHSSPHVRAQAQAALAALGDKSIIKALKISQGDEISSVRREAALHLVTLGEFSTAATSLGDNVASVRTQVACAMLAAP
jgi:hypothetical protein